MSARRTIRRFAHELYPHPDEGEVQPLAVVVPYLYARATGLNTWGTDWFDLSRPDRPDAERRLSFARITEMINARQRALLADALLQGLGGQEAWEWAESRMDEEGGWIYERATHYGVPVYQIKPYLILAEPGHHDHHDTTGNATGWGIITCINCPESECEACTEPVEAGGSR